MIEIIKEDTQVVKDRIAKEAKRKLQSILQSRSDKKKHSDKQFAAGKTRKGIHAMMAQAKNQSKVAAERSEQLAAEKLEAKLEKQRAAAEKKAAQSQAQKK